MRTLMIIVTVVAVGFTTSCANLPAITPAGQSTVQKPAANVEPAAVPEDAAAQKAQAMAALMDAMFPAPPTDPAKPAETAVDPANPAETAPDPANPAADDLATALDAPRAAAARQDQIDAVAAKLTARGITADRLTAAGFSGAEEYLRYLEFAAGYLGKAWKGIPITPAETLLLWKEQKRREAEKARVAAEAASKPVVPGSTEPPAPPSGDKAAPTEPKPDEKK